jgi:hypothetical protein
VPLKACQYKHSTNTTKTHYKSHKTHKPNPPQHLSRNQGTRAVRRGSDARVHYQLNNTQEAHPGHPHIHAGPDKHLHREPTRSLQRFPHPPPTGSKQYSPSRHQPDQASSTIPLVNTTNAPRTDAEGAGYVLLRKEVIQPHLPVRLPCYDFVPIASPTFDSSPHTRWLGHWLRVLPTFVT